MYPTTTREDELFFRGLFFCWHFFSFFHTLPTPAAMQPIRNAAARRLRDSTFWREGLNPDGYNRRRGAKQALMINAFPYFFRQIFPDCWVLRKKNFQHSTVSLPDLEISPRIISTKHETTMKIELFHIFSRNKLNRNLIQESHLPASHWSSWFFPQNSNIDFPVVKFLLYKEEKPSSLRPSRKRPPDLHEGPTETTNEKKGNFNRNRSPQKIWKTRTGLRRLMVEGKKCHIHLTSISSPYFRHHHHPCSNPRVFHTQVHATVRDVGNPRDPFFVLIFMFFFRKEKSSTSAAETREHHQ